jgi:hypothetical protein
LFLTQFFHIRIRKISFLNSKSIANTRFSHYQQVLAGLGQKDDFILILDDRKPKCGIVNLRGITVRLEGPEGGVVRVGAWPLTPSAFDSDR